LKQLYEGSGTQVEVGVGGYFVDVVRDDVFIEIQTRNFAAIKGKLLALMKNHATRLVYPIAVEKWVVRQDSDGESELSRRRSPRRLGYADVFEELVSIPTLFLHKNFSLEVILICEEEIRRQDGKGSWRRRGWRSIDRRLLDVIDRRLYSQPSDFLHLLPDTLHRPFKTSELAEAAGVSKRIAQKMAYCLRKMGVLHIVGKEKNALLLTT
jgi:hypothetical protein